MTDDSAAVDFNHYDGHGRVLGSYSGIVGQRLSFGSCFTGCCQPHIETPGASGHVVGYREHWMVANHSNVSMLVVRHAEHRTDRITIHPGQGDTYIPFDIAEILGAGGHVLTAMGAGPTTHDCNAPCAGDIPVTWGLDPTTMYFKVAITAVRPIIHGTDQPLPTRAQIAAELGLTMRQLYDHLTHLCELLNLAPPAGTTGPWRLAALAHYAREHPFIAP